MRMKCFMLMHLDSHLQNLLKQPGKIVKLNLISYTGYLELEKS